MTIQRKVKISVATDDGKYVFTLNLPFMLTSKEAANLIAVTEDGSTFELEDGGVSVMEFLEAVGVVESFGKPSKVPERRYMLAPPPSVRATMFKQNVLSVVK
jgi:hypothetical protein